MLKDSNTQTCIAFQLRCWAQDGYFNWILYKECDLIIMKKVQLTEQYYSTTFIIFLFAKISS